MQVLPSADNYQIRQHQFRFTNNNLGDERSENEGWNIQGLFYTWFPNMWAVLSDILWVYFYYYWQALFTLYSGQDHVNRDTAHKWLLTTQKSQHAWQLCWRLMQSDKVWIYLDTYGVVNQSTIILLLLKTWKILIHVAHFRNRRTWDKYSHFIFLQKTKPFKWMIILIHLVPKIKIERKK